MKHGKKPTRKQKMLIRSTRLNCDNWLVIKDSDDELVLQNRQTNKLRTIPKNLYK